MFGRREIASAIVVAVCAAGASALDAFGPPFGANRYTTSIADSDGARDVDDYVASLLAGESLTVSVAANKGSSLLPTLDLIDPDGAMVAPPVVEQKGGVKVGLKAFAIAKTGRWAVRIGGKDGTQGAYTVVFGVKAGKPLALKNQTLGGAAPLFVDIPFDGIDGALVSFAAKGSKTQSQLHVGSVKGPDGEDVAGLQPVEKSGSVSVSSLRLDRGDGVYTLRLFIDAGAAKYSLTLKTTPQARPKSKKPVTLPSGEPFLEPRATPIRGAAGFRVAFNGSNLGGAAAPTVYFGRAQGSGVDVAPDGHSLTVVPPPGTSGATVSVAVVAQDGQGSAQDAYFLYVPAPTITDLVRADGSQARGGSGVGGAALRLLGTNFEEGNSVFFGARPATSVVVVSPTLITLVTPTGPTGPATVSVRDAFGRSVNASFLFEYKAPPQFSTPSYDPPYGPVSGGTTITVRGLGFEPADRLFFDGAEIASTFVSASRRTFVLPVRAEGAYGVRLVDRFESAVSGPDFAVRGPPTITSVQAVGGAHVGTDAVAIGGGAVVRITGTNLAASHLVSLGGTQVTADSGSATQIEFTTPAGEPGAASVVVQDAVGQSATATDALRLVGFQDATGARSPGKSSVDDLTAIRGAMGDLDEDGADDDVVLVSFKSSPGSRNEFTRIFFGNASGALVDVTATKFPTAGSDPEGVDDFHAAAVAIGDLDDTAGKEIVIAGEPTQGTYYYYYTYYYREARVFANGGTGTFTFDPRSPEIRTDSVTCNDGSGNNFPVFRPNGTNSAVARAVAVGDLDGDGDQEIVTAGDMFRSGLVYIDPSYVTFTPGNYVDTQAATHYSYYGTFVYTPALRIFDNQDTAFVDVTFPRAPMLGSSGTVPALLGRDIAIGDIDGKIDDPGEEDYPDIVVTWDDPLTVTPYSIYYTATAYVATRVLRNDGNGFFSDVTDEVLPAPADPEYWQGHRVKLVDLDSDDDLDLLILHEQALDAFQGGPTYNRSALRVLRNDGDSGFTDVTDTALPTVPLEGTVDDNLRGGAIAIRDVDGDGLPDVFVSTTDQLTGAGGGAVRRTRLLLNGPSLQFTVASGFLPSTADESGEAEDVLIGDLAGGGSPALVLVTQAVPAQSTDAESLRVLDWND